MEQVASSEAQRQTSFSHSAQGAEQPVENIPARTAGEYLDKALKMLGASMRSAASLVKERSPREQGIARNAFESASKVLEKTGQYMLKEHPSQNVRGIVKRYPLRSVGVCFVAGVLAGSVLRAVRR